MMEIDLCAPGPSMSQAVVDALRGRAVGVVGCVFQLAPWADFLVANDSAWWEQYPAARDFTGRRFSGNRLHGVEWVRASSTDWNSGVLALQVAYQLGARLVRLHGFDMHGSHYFGPYANGLANTPPHIRGVHLKQFRVWACEHPDMQVVNCTEGSSLDCFPFEVAA